MRRSWNLPRDNLHLVASLLYCTLIGFLSSGCSSGRLQKTLRLTPGLSLLFNPNLSDLRILSIEKDHNYRALILYPSLFSALASGT
jgi:hypothetical protein